MQPDLMQIFGSYTSYLAAEDTWFISAMNGSQFMYLLIGSERALLLDTLYGAGNLRAYVEKLTDKPVMVFNSHGHLDHSGGNGEWEQVYMLPDAPAEIACYDGPFDLSALPYPAYQKRFVGEGDMIDLGGRRIELLDISAHSNSSLALLDLDRRMLFVGDELESAQVLMFDTGGTVSKFEHFGDRLRAHHRNMKKLSARSNDYDWICPAHNGSPIAKSYLDAYMALVEHIFVGDAIIEDRLNHVHIERDPIAPFLCRVRYGQASFFVKKEELLTIYGKETL